MAWSLNLSAVAVIVVAASQLRAVIKRLISHDSSLVFLNNSTSPPLRPVDASFGGKKNLLVSLLPLYPVVLKWVQLFTHIGIPQVPQLPV